MAGIVAEIQMNDIQLMISMSRQIDRIQLKLHHQKGQNKHPKKSIEIIAFFKF